MKSAEGGLSAVQGFASAGIHAGIKKAKKDLALIVSNRPAAAAGVFTTNRVQAAPVVYDRQVLKSGAPVRAILVNSGNANACTGEQGIKDASVMAEAAASALGLSASEVLVSSTGVIGVPLPMDRVLSGIRTAAAAAERSPAAARAAAEAILTTDTFVKEIALEVQLPQAGVTVTVAGIAKGSGMIHPNMATLLAYIITDAQVAAEDLQQLLGSSVQASFNMISVDGDTSTNDTVIALANGAADARRVVPGTGDFRLFAEAFDAVSRHLAREIVRDGEGATKFIEARMEGARTLEDARLLAKAVITSNLVKTAFFGEDANWGRILCAMGYSGGAFSPEQVDLTISSRSGSMLLLREGTPVPFDEAEALKILKEKEILITAALGEGEQNASAWGCDLSYEYVKINGEYRT
jgi:glutamate N-acetyltransferase / amino-acid N-acetyltransferase